MPQATVPLLYACSIAGLVMVVGGIWLIAREKIYIDRETREVTAIELPFGVKLQTNLPALALFVLGFVPLIYPLTYAPQLVDMVSLSGEVQGNEFPIDIYAVVKWDKLHESGTYNIPVPRIDRQQGEYRVLVLAASGSSEYVVGYKQPDLTSATPGVLHVPPTNFVARAGAEESELKLKGEVDPVDDEFR